MLRNPRELLAVREGSHHQPERAVQAAWHRRPRHPESGAWEASHHQPEPGASHRPERTVALPAPHPCPGHPREAAGLRRYPARPELFRPRVPVVSEPQGPSIRRRNPEWQEHQAPQVHPPHHRHRCAVRGQKTTPRSTRQARRRVRWLRTPPPSPGLRWQVPLLRSRPAAPVPSTACACSPERCRARGSMRRESVGSDRSR